jgi:hypothetical protein
MGCHMSLEGFYLLLTENPVELPVKIGITFFYLNLIHACFSFYPSREL